MPFGNKHIFEDLFSSIFSPFKKYNPSCNLKFNYLGRLFPKLKIVYSRKRIVSLSLKLNFTPNTSGFYG